MPTDISEELTNLGNRGVIPIRANVGGSAWKTSLLPMGDGTHFVALNKAVRTAEDLDAGDRVTVAFVPREP